MPAEAAVSRRRRPGLAWAWPLLLLAAAAGAANLARFTLSPLQESVRGTLQLTDHQMALLQGPALALPMVLAAAPLGVMLDRTSRARILKVLGLLMLAGTAATALATNFLSLFAARCLVGLAATAVPLAATALISDLFPEARRGRAQMVVSMTAVGGMSAAFALGGLLLSSHGDAWRPAMWWLAAPVAAGAISLLLLREPPRTGASDPRRPFHQDLRALWSRRSLVLPLLAGGVMVGVADGAALVWAAPVLIRDQGLSAAEAGGLIATATLASGLAGPMLGGFLADLCQASGGSRRTLLALAALAFASAPAAAFGLAAPGPATLLLLTVFLAAGLAVSVMISTLIIVAIPDELRGVCLSLKYLANLLFGLAVAPLAVSLVSERLGGGPSVGAALALVGATTSALGALTFLLGRAAAARSVP